MKKAPQKLNSLTFGVHFMKNTEHCLFLFVEEPD